MKLEPHPISKLIPPHRPEELNLLRVSIKTGIHPGNTIVLYEGMILDGVGRNIIANELGIQWPTVEYTGDDPIGFVIAANVNRRHLTKIQRLEIAEKVFEYQKKEASKRQAASQFQPGHKPNVPGTLKIGTAEENNENHRETTGDGQLSATSAQTALKAGAAGLGFSDKTLDRFRFVKAKGIPPVVAAMQTNQLSIGRCHEIAKLPKEEQSLALEAAMSKGRRSAFEQTHPGVILDDLKQIVPERLHSIFNTRKEFDSILHQLSAILKRVEDICNSRAGKYLWMPDMDATIRKAYRDISFARPFALCPQCLAKRPSCKMCAGHGWLTKAIYGNTPKEIEDGPAPANAQGQGE